jgi:hypothetical protein
VEKGEYMSDPLHDDEFRPSHEIRLEAPSDHQPNISIYAYNTQRSSKYVNVEFIQEEDERTGLPRKMVDAYFFPEDLERLGVLFQYLGKVTREARDGTA